MPKIKTYDVPLTAMEMFYTRWAVRNFIDALRNDIIDLHVRVPKDEQDATHIREALTRKNLQVDRLESALDKMLEAGEKATSENPYL